MSTSSKSAYSAVLAHTGYAGMDSSTPIEGQIKALIASLHVLAKEYDISMDTETADIEPAALSFTLLDEAEDDSINGTADAKSDLGLSVFLKGYGDCCSQDHCGTPIYIEKYDGEVFVRIYGDINAEEPTHNISLAGARLEKRLSPIEVMKEKITNFHQLTFTENRTICEQNGSDGTSIGLKLSRVLKNNTHMIRLTGYAYKDKALLGAVTLGHYPCSDESPAMVIGATECYSYCGMLELITKA